MIKNHSPLIAGCCRNVNIEQFCHGIIHEALELIIDGQCSVLSKFDEVQQVDIHCDTK